MDAVEDTALQTPRPAAPVVIAGYELLERIGQGGMGAVYRARQVRLNRMVAVKVLPARFAARPEFLERFRREARLAARLNHPNIVRVYDVGESAGVNYLSMEFVEGESLMQRIAGRGPLGGAEVVAVGKAVAQALVCTEEAGIVHRDIKPSNILLARDGGVKLADLGLAKEAAGADAGLTRRDETLGTPSYMAPEQAIGRRHLDVRSDIYALGATLFHAACGRPPFVGPTSFEVMRLHVEQPAPAAHEVNPAVSAALSAVIARMLAKKPGDRYQFPRQVWAALVEAEQAGRSAALPAPTRAGGRGWGRACLRHAGRAVAWALLVPGAICVMVSYFAAPVLLPLIWLLKLPVIHRLVMTAAVIAANPLVWRAAGAAWRRVGARFGKPR